jgi:D-sedoheptulose 7-phosphate isomerase
MTPREHICAVRQALEELDGELERIGRWGQHLAAVLGAGGRLLAAGNGGSAAHAQHLTAELVGRYESERRPLSALALHAETSTLTALGNDYPPDQLFARQVRAHGRDDDVLLAFSTSGRSPNVISAVEAARARGLTTWALTGAAPNPLAACADDSLCVAAPSTATVQEVHQVVIHLLCRAVDEALDAPPGQLDRRSAAAR